MSQKKRAKRFGKLLAEQFDEWLSERTPEELAQVRVRMGVTKAKFTATVETKQETRGETAA